ncbi:MAG: hypothetical protein F6K26_05780 [Moorea sp. SIO2I5]|nr:hypothetical protein [Moorena sp. SIO2I5]
MELLTTVPCSLLPLTCSLLPTDSIPDSRFPIPDSRFTINPMFTTQIQTRLVYMPIFSKTSWARDLNSSEAIE